MSISSINSLLSSQNIYNNQLYRGVDKNKDSAFSKQEVTNFAADYEDSTGVKLDVESLFKAYDADQDGALSGSEYKSVVSDDAMGMSRLYGSLPSAEGEAETESSSVNGTDMSDWLSSLSGRTKNSLVQSTFRAETTGNLINAMFGSGGLFANMNNAISQYNSAKSYNSLQNLNSMFASFSLYL